MQEKLKHVHCDFFQPQILAFDMVCKTRSFSEAGKALGVSQSNISRRVLSLEKKLGISLIDRNVRPLKLTSEGQLLQDLIRKQIDVVDARLLAVMQRGHKKVLLRLGCITSLEHDLDAPFSIAKTSIDDSFFRNPMFLSFLHPRRFPSIRLGRICGFADYRKSAFPRALPTASSNGCIFKSRASNLSKVSSVTTSIRSLNLWSMGSAGASSRRFLSRLKVLDTAI